MAAQIFHTIRSLLGGETSMASTALRSTPVRSSAATRRSKEIDEIQEQLSDLLAARPVAHMRRSSGHLELRPLQSGFPISIGFIDSQQTYLCLGNWMEDEYDSAQIARMARLALTGEIRVRETLLNSQPWKVSIEARHTSGTWHEASQVSFVRLPRLGRPVTTRLSQYPLT